jgi:pimeloyl-ACP methyl ester carboxylesterase
MSTQTGPDQYLDVHGARLRWRIAGAGPGLVLLHGWPLDLEYWDPLCALLTPQFTVMRFDRRGFGLSSGLPDIHRNVEDLCALLDEVDMERPVLIGMSQGARLALHFASRHRQRTRALVLEGAPAVETETEIPLAGYRALLAEQGLAALRAVMVQHPLLQLHGADPAARGLLARVVDRYHAIDLQHQVPRDHAPDLAAIAIPTLILNGSLDSAARLAAGRKLQTVIAGARRQELPGAGHLAALDDPAAYAAAVAAFCRALPP